MTANSHQSSAFRVLKFWISGFGLNSSRLWFHVSRHGRQARFVFRILNLRFRILIGFCLLVFGMLTNGCSSTPSKPYDRALVTTYAELTLLYEKEKMVNKEVDSLYQVKVKDFFAQKGYQREKFKEVIDELSKHPEAWKMFLQDVTTAMDSLKRIGTKE